MLFFKPDKNNDCPVCNLWDNLEGKRKSLLFKQPESHFLKEQYESFSSFIRKAGVKITSPQNMVVFGCRDEQYPVVNAASGEQYIPYSWFNGGKKSKMSFFFHEKQRKTVDFRTMAGHIQELGRV